MDVLDIAKRNGMLTEKPVTIVISNGSRWQGEGPYDLGHLIDVLKKYKLEKRFFGKTNLGTDKKPIWGPRSPLTFNPYKKWEFLVELGFKKFFGNFERLSNVFNIYSNDPAVIEPLTKAILENEGWKEYSPLIGAD